MRIPDEVLAVLSTMTVEGLAARFPEGERIEKNLYERTRRVLVELGGKWMRYRKVFAFADDPSDRLEQTIASREISTVKEIGFFPTPIGLAKRLVDLAGVLPGHRVLEPSAGTGRIAMAILYARPAELVCVELDADRADGLRSLAIPGVVTIIADDFLNVLPGLNPANALAASRRIDSSGIDRGDERWLPVVGFEDLYEVSSWGRIRRLTTRKAFKAGTFLKPSLRTDGYLSLTFCRDGKHGSILAHQVVAAAFIGPCPPGHEVNHRHPDGDRARNWASNLEYVTSGSNNADQRIHRPAKYAVKMTASEAVEARRRVAAGEPQDSIAADYGVTASNISVISRGGSWINYLPSFDRICMNPAFGRQRDIDHVLHAWKFLKIGGRLVSVMSAGVTFRQDRKTLSFREFVSANDGVIEHLPDDSFAESGTKVRTVVVSMRKKLTVANVIQEAGR